MKLRILFICGSLETGKDGVGDYTRRLAGELLHKGHDCSILSLNDKFIDQIFTGSQIEKEVEIEILRLPGSLQWSARVAHAKRYINNYMPDWVSLQYVPFAYNKKGLPFLLAKDLIKIGGRSKWHIMFHELWTGSETFKLKILSSLQKVIIKNMIKTLKPQIIHTHLPAYYRKLRDISDNIYELPLFSNFEVDSNHTQIKSNIFKIAFFNLIGEQQEIITFLTKMDQVLQANNLIMEIILIGGAIEKLNNFRQVLIDRYNFQNNIYCPGFLQDSKLAALIQTCDLGLTPLPRSAIGKSGTSIAFLSCGVPLAVPIPDRRDPPFFNIKMNESLVYEPSLDAINLARSSAINEKEYIKISYIADKFLSDINNK